MGQYEINGKHPVNVWRSFYDTNTALWTQSVAAMINTDAVANMLGVYFDNYLASAEPFRKITEQYMDFLLLSLNMPSRDDIERLTRQMTQTEARLNEISEQVHHFAGALPPPPEYGAADLPERIQALDSKMNQILQFLQSQETPPSPSTNEPSARSASSALQSRVESLDARVGQLLQLIRQVQAAPDSTAPDSTAA